MPNQDVYERLTTQELRQSFVVEHLFGDGTMTLVYCDADRAILGGAVPGKKALQLEATKKEMAAEYFTERREIGIANIGNDGKVTVNGKAWSLQNKDMLYVGRGKKRVELSSDDPARPARFYLVSYPAHQEYPDTLIRAANAETANLGTPEAANVRALHKYIHAGGARSCQLVMGLTDLASGSVWNTMPAHTHMRRSEVYLYFGIDPEAMVVHLMGKPEQSRNLIMRDGEAVVSPSWSIHTGVGTRNYSFIWAMGGENQEFSDMDAVPMKTLL